MGEWIGMTVEEMVKALRKCEWEKPVVIEISTLRDIPDGWEWDSSCFSIEGLDEQANEVFLTVKHMG